MVLTALVLGTAAAVAGTGRVTLSLVVSTTICWSFVPILQLLTGVLLVAPGRGDRRRALASYFETGRYWSAWVLALAAALLMAPDPGPLAIYLLMTAVVPLLLTARALVTVRREVFGDSRTTALRIVVAHQGLSIVLILGYAAWASALWARLAPGIG